jgi:hypothetical protein
MHCEDDGIALLKGNDIGTRRGRRRGGHHELATVELHAGLREKHGDLERKDMLTVEVLVQAIEVSLAVAKQKRRGTLLTGRVAAAKERGVGLGESLTESQDLVPSIRDRHERLVQGAAKLRERWRQRIRKVLVLAEPEAMPRHHDA